MSQRATPHMASGSLAACVSMLSRAQWKGVIIQPTWRGLGFHGCYLVSAVQQDAVHAGIEEWLTLPPVLHIYHNVQHGQEGKGKAGSDEDIGEAPEVLIDGDPAALLAGTTEEGTEATCQD